MTSSVLCCARIVNQNKWPIYCMAEQMSQHDIYVIKVFDWQRTLHSLKNIFKTEIWKTANCFNLLFICVIFGGFLGFFFYVFLHPCLFVLFLFCFVFLSLPYCDIYKILWMYNNWSFKQLFNANKHIIKFPK
jgi:hypothetical protein